jgi:hypothetical protein
MTESDIARCIYDYARIGRWNGAQRTVAGTARQLPSRSDGVVTSLIPQLRVGLIASTGPGR